MDIPSPSVSYSNNDAIASSHHGLLQLFLQTFSPSSSQSSDNLLSSFFSLSARGLGSSSDLDDTVHSSNMGLGRRFDPATLLHQRQKVNIQILSVVTASCSVFACVVALYWFILMRRTFRRTLIMLLLVADLWKSLWFLIFPAVALSKHGITSGDPFCDAGGFFIQMGLESCDFAILMLSLHLSMQVLNPSPGASGSDGLHRYRYAVFAGWVVLPGFMASLAFINGTAEAYLSQGALCSLPIRPFWFRLALSWIPRYLIWCYVIYVVIRIYMRVGGTGLEVFGRNVDGSATPAGVTSNMDTTRFNTNVDRSSKLMFSAKQRPFSGISMTNSNLTDTPMLPPFMSETQDGRRPSTKRWDSGAIKNEKEFDAASGASPPSSRRPSEQQHSPSKEAFSSDEISTTHITIPESTLTVPPRSRQPSAYELLQISDLPTITEIQTQPLPDMNSLQSSLESTGHGGFSNAKRRRAILRQIRLLFVYPAVYMICMIFPCISHALNYSDYYAQHPIYWVTAMATFSFSFMGVADCLVFSWREKPWTCIPGSSGTFWGSFCFWRFMFSTGPLSRFYTGNWAPEPPTLTLHDYGNGSERPGSSSSAMKRFAEGIKIKRPRPPMHRRTFSGQSERAALAAERAAERLALERAAQTQRPSFLVEKENGEPSKKEWFDRRESDLFDDDDEDEQSQTDTRMKGFGAA